jgi:cell division topological specificity factor
MASFLSFLLGEKKKTASVAKERLQIILAHERTGRGPKPDYLPALQRDLIAVIAKYIAINPEHIKLHLERQDNLDVLEVKITELPYASTRSETRATPGQQLSATSAPPEQARPALKTTKKSSQDS